MGLHSGYRTWIGGLKFTKEHALFLAMQPPEERKAALLDYWLGRLSFFALFFVSGNVAAHYGVGVGHAAPPPGVSREEHVPPFAALDQNFKPTVYFPLFFLTAALIFWFFILKPEFSYDSKLVNNTNMLPPRLPLVGHSQIFWRDAIRTPTDRARHRIHSLWCSYQGLKNDTGITPYWLRPWSPVLYLTSRNAIRQLFMLEENVDIYVGGRACRCLPKILWGCGFGHDMPDLQKALRNSDFEEFDNAITSRSMRHLVAKLNSVIPKKRRGGKFQSDEVDLGAIIGNVLTTAICESLLGHGYRASPELMGALEIAIDGAAAVFAAPPVSFPPSWLWRRASVEGSRIWAAASKIRTCVKEALEARRTRIFSDGRNAKLTCAADFLAELQLYDQLSEDDAVEQLAAFLVQRLAVTIPGVVWAVLEFSRINATAIKAILKEGKSGATALAMHENEMPLFVKCMQESFRLHPPAPALAPVTLFRDARLNRINIRRGTEIRILPYLLQRSEFWDKKLEFDFLRWSTTCVNARPPFSQLPFGAGLLSCVKHNAIRHQIMRFTYAIISRFQLQISGLKDADQKTASPGVEKSQMTANRPSRNSILMPDAGVFAVLQVRS